MLWATPVLGVKAGRLEPAEGTDRAGWGGQGLLKDPACSGSCKAFSEAEWRPSAFNTSGDRIAQSRVLQPSDKMQVLGPHLRLTESRSLEERPRDLHYLNTFQVIALFSKA